MGKAESTVEIDRTSFQLGMINCFAEMVACGVKKLALSPPVSPEDYKKIEIVSDDIVKNCGIKSYLEKSLLITDLQTPGFTKGKWSILYYEDEEILNAYLALKKKKHRLEKSGNYNKKARWDISREFMRLLSYSDEKINEKLSKPKPKDPYMPVGK